MKILTVSDLHQRATLYDQLATAVELHRPDVVALVGDFLNVWQHGGSFLSPQECSRRLNALPVAELICVRGNHEDVNWLDFPPGRVRSLNGSAFQSGPLVIVGFPCLLGDDSWFLEGASAASPEISEWFPTLVERHGPAARTLWLMHEPPDGTSLSMRSGPLRGNPEWREAIERYSPLVVVCGHDHHTPWQGGNWCDPMGETFCFNAGQQDETLQHLVVELVFSPGVSLPTCVTVTHHPRKQVRIVRHAEG